MAPIIFQSVEKVAIDAYDKDGLFYGINTLSQIVEGVSDDNLPMVEINDYPALKYRGVVEGFYGNPWSHETRLSILDFMGRHKMNSYVYGPGMILTTAPRTGGNRILLKKEEK